MRPEKTKEHTGVDIYHEWAEIIQFLLIVISVLGFGLLGWMFLAGLQGSTPEAHPYPELLAVIILPAIIAYLLKFVIE